MPRKKEQNNAQKVCLSEDGVKIIMTSFCEFVMNASPHSAVIRTEFIGKDIPHKRFSFVINFYFDLFLIEYEMPLITADRRGQTQTILSDRVNELINNTVNDLMAMFLELRFRYYNV